MSNELKEDAYPLKWQWWRVAEGEWKETELDWLEGTLTEIVKKYGGYIERPMIERDFDNLSLGVYSLCRKGISPAVKVQLSEYHAMSDEDQDKAHEEWESNSPVEWLWYFEGVYPSSHLIFVHYGLIEAYGIFCKTFKDMLDAVKLLRGGA